MIIFFLFSGLLIGFTLGFYDLYLLLGARVIKNRRTLWFLVFFASISLILGALTNTNGAFLFVGKLASVMQIQVAFLILASALITITLLRFKFKIISVSHAVIGSITGWLLFVDDELPLKKLLAIIIIWLITPIISAILSASYLTLLKTIMRRLHLHMLKVGRILQLLLFMALLVGAYSFGANNIANVVGVYEPVFARANIHLLEIDLSGSVVLIVFGVLAITLGLVVRILRNSSKPELSIFNFSPETNFSVLAAFGTVFFLFSSTIFLKAIGFIGISYPLAPISALHILTAGVIGVSYKKGFSVYQKDSFAGLAFGFVLTPVLSGLIMFVAALGLKSFWGTMGSVKTTSLDKVQTINDQGYLTQFLSINDSSVVYNLIVILLLASIVVFGIIIYTQMKNRFNKEREGLIDNKSELEAEKNYFKNALEYSEEQATSLQQEIDFKNRELEKFAFNLLEKEEILDKAKDILLLVKKLDSSIEKKKITSELSNLILDNLNLSNDRISFYQRIDEINKDFYIRLSQQFNNLTDNDKKLIALLKLGLSSKEISSIVNISTKSVEMNRYRLRQKLSLLSDQNLLEFVNNI